MIFKGYKERGFRTSYGRKQLVNREGAAAAVADTRGLRCSGSQYHRPHAPSHCTTPQTRPTQALDQPPTLLPTNITNKPTSMAPTDAITHAKRTEPSNRQTGISPHLLHATRKLENNTHTNQPIPPKAQPRSPIHWATDHGPPAADHDRRPWNTDHGTRVMDPDHRPPTTDHRPWTYNSRQPTLPPPPPPPPPPANNNNNSSSSSRSRRSTSCSRSSSSKEQQHQ